MRIDKQIEEEKIKRALILEAAKQNNLKIKETGDVVSVTLADILVIQKQTTSRLRSRCVLFATVILCILFIGGQNEI